MSMLGECPYDDCEQFAWRILPASTPCFGRDVCKGCGRILWVLYSRIDPQVFTEAEFLQKWRVDESTRTILALKNN